MPSLSSEEKKFVDNVRRGHENGVDDQIDEVSSDAINQALKVVQTALMNANRQDPYSELISRLNSIKEKLLSK